MCERTQIQNYRKQIEKANYALLNRAYLFKEVSPVGDTGRSRVNVIEVKNVPINY